MVGTDPPRVTREEMLGKALDLARVVAVWFSTAKRRDMPADQVNSAGLSFACESDFRMG